MLSSRYEYGTTPRKIEPELTPAQRKAELEKRLERKLEVTKTDPVKRKKANKAEKQKKLKQAAYILVAFLALLTISYRNSLINENFSKVQSMKEELASIQKENEQLEVTIENKMNFNNIEEAAKEKLGMQKQTSKQTVYVSLAKKDYVEPASEEVVINEKTESVVEKVINKLTEFVRWKNVMKINCIFLFFISYKTFF